MSEEPSSPPQKPFVTWVLIALLPSYYGYVVGLMVWLQGAETAQRSWVAELAGLSLLVPVVAVPYLLIVAYRYMKAQPVPSGKSYLGFVVGFWFLNLLVWALSCQLTLPAINIH